VGEIVIPQRQRLNQNSRLHQNVKGDTGHIKLGVDEIPPLTFQHHGEIEIALRALMGSPHDLFKTAR